MKLHGFFRSTASWRVRIACALKGVSLDHQSYKLRRGDQRSDAYLALNPQGLVPALELDDGTVLTQSLAIIEWLEETIPEPHLLPSDPIARAKVRAFALAIAADIHPVQNLKVLFALAGHGLDEAAVNGWAATVITEGLGACEKLIADQDGPYCFGDTVGLADICLVPQIGNAKRFGVDLAAFPKLMAVDAACAQLPAFADAVPGRQADAE
ncbi:maleylacetoacetate isomerase [Rhodospirillaceae bacterium KN72]|uniref:Maleylacetoacetate isomerase n=1 Tax=Pacificispira spongiicola TaxID=2729598 RepID=A0A7Y0HD54_9PROT|nr:maleylacetoacetate isomerase [Pacificispira spongiicola]NMM43280.1 maleylacetoacetate isomerase [Pacificispira spongiicola]